MTQQFVPAGVQLQIQGLAGYLAGMRAASQVTGVVFVGAVGAAAAAAGALAIAAGGVAITLGGISLKAAVDFEHAMVGVLRTMEPTDEQFENIKLHIRGLAQEIPYTTTELAKIGEEVGRMGIRGVEGATVFTEAMADVLTTSEFTADGAVRAYARIMKIMDEPVSAIRNITSAATELDNAMATSEMEIVQFALRMAAAGKVAGFTTADVLGVSAAFRELDIRAERGGTAVQTVIFQIQKSVMEGGDKLALFARVSGMTVAQFVDLWETDAAMAFVSFVEGLGKAGDMGQIVMKELGLGAQRTVQAFLTVGAAGESLRDAIERSRGAYTAGTATAREAQRVYATNASQLKVLRNQFHELTIEIGIALLPALRAVVAFIRRDVLPALRGAALAIHTDVIPAMGVMFDIIFSNAPPAGAEVTNLGDRIEGLVPPFAHAVFGAISFAEHILAMARTLIAYIGVASAAIEVTSALGNALGRLGAGDLAGAGMAWEGVTAGIDKFKRSQQELQDVMGAGEDITARYNQRISEFSTEFGKARMAAVGESRALEDRAHVLRGNMAATAQMIGQVTAARNEIVGMGQDTAELDAYLGRLNTSLDSDAKSFLDLGLGAKESGVELDNLKGWIGGLGDESEDTGEDVDGLTDSFDDLIGGGGGAEGGGGLKGAEEAAKDVKTVLEQLGIAASGAREFLLGLGFSNDEVVAKLMLFGAELIDLGDQLEDFGLNTIQAQMLLEAFGLSATEAAARVDALTTATEARAMAEAEAAAQRQKDAEEEAERLREEAQRLAEEAAEAEVTLGELMGGAYQDQSPFAQFMRSMLDEGQHFTEEATAVMEDWRRQFTEFSRDADILLKAVEEKGTLGSELFTKQLTDIITAWKLLPPELQDGLDEVIAKLKELQAEYQLTATGAVDLTKRNNAQMAKLVEEWHDTQIEIYTGHLANMATVMEIERQQSIKLAEERVAHLKMVHDYQRQAQERMETRERETAARMRAREMAAREEQGRVLEATAVLKAGGIDSITGEGGLAKLAAVAEHFQLGAEVLLSAISTNGIYVAKSMDEMLATLQMQWRQIALAEQFNKIITPALGASSGPWAGLMGVRSAPVVAGMGGRGRGDTNITVNANYSSNQNPGSVMMDLEAIRMLGLV